MRYLAKTKEQTVSLGEQFAKTLTGGDVVLLDGDLGAGKTTFTKGIARALGVSHEVTSPTFTLVNRYEGQHFDLCHFDAYRIKSGEEAIFAGLGEMIGDKQCVCVIEWYENIAEILPHNTKKVKLAQKDERTREIEFC